MARQSVMIPKLSVAAHEATLVEWLVADGVAVGEGDPIYIVETEKVETEIVAPVAGVLHVSGVPGETYDVGTEIGYIDVGG
jgi:pyruvate/2-oxoglutarate dehydrogenase complex dihydrolipoamide acyltransferase (E2) component